MSIQKKSIIHPTSDKRVIRFPHSIPRIPTSKTPHVYNYGLKKNYTNYNIEVDSRRRRVYQFFPDYRVHDFRFNTSHHSARPVSTTSEHGESHIYIMF